MNYITTCYEIFRFNRYAYPNIADIEYKQENGAIVPHNVKQVGQRTKKEGKFKVLTSFFLKAIFNSNISS